MVTQNFCHHMIVWIVLKQFVRNLKLFRKCFVYYLGQMFSKREFDTILIQETLQQIQVSGKAQASLTNCSSSKPNCSTAKLKYFKWAISATQNLNNFPPACSRIRTIVRMSETMEMSWLQLQSLYYGYDNSDTRNQNFSKEFRLQLFFILSSRNV